MRFSSSLVSFVTTLVVLAAPGVLSTPTKVALEAKDAASSSTITAAKCGTPFKYTGVNEAGAEFGNQVIPGELGKHYTWPSPSSVDYFMDRGMNTFRIAFQMERLAPPATGIAGPFDATYLSGLRTIVDYVTGKGGYAAIDPHNFMIYDSAQITNGAAFATFWSNLAKEFINTPNVIFDLMNEPHDMDANLVASQMQTAVNAIRETGATQLILVEGTSWSGAWTWTSSSGNGAAFAGFTDPLNNTLIEMHQYLDIDGSGTSDQCVSSTIGAERIASATKWLQETGHKGLLGEMGVGSNSQCISAITGALCDMQKSGVWVGFLYWAAGPWWGPYFQSIEPPNGPSIEEVLPAIQPYLDLRL